MSDQPSDRPEVDAVDLVALHHPVRRRIFERLHVEGPATVGTLAAALGQQVGSISHHLRTLEKVGFVEPAPELAKDRRESWWRALTREVTWSITDFTDSPTDLLLATAAERANLQHHNDKVLAWFTDREEHDAAWTDAAFSTEVWTHATPDELGDLSRRLYDLLAGWKADCDEAARREGSEQDDGAGGPRLPVFVFAHGNPSTP